MTQAEHTKVAFDQMNDLLTKYPDSDSAKMVRKVRDMVIELIEQADRVVDETNYRLLILLGEYSRDVVERGGGSMT